MLAREGDDRAFGELVRRRQAQVRMLLRRLCGEPALGDDLAQDAFVRAWQSLRQLREAAAFGPWLRRIAVSVWLQHARRKQVAIEALDDHDLPADSSAPPIGQHLEVHEALARLRPAERLCLVLAYSEGLSQTEIAEATGLPLGTVKSHMTRGMGRLRQLFASPILKGAES